MSNIAFGIIHGLRGRDHLILPTTLRSLHAAGVGEVTIFSDAGEFGAARNLLRAIRSLASTGSKHVCVLDDDLVVHPGFRHKLFDGMVEYQSFKHGFSLWTIEQNIPHEFRNRVGWVPVAPHFHMWGGSVVLHATVVGDVTYHMQRLLDADPALNTKPDAVLFQAMQDAGMTALFHLPSLVDHLGLESSTLGNDHSSGGTRGYRFNDH
jgi:hypothetical protein